VNHFTVIAAITGAVTGIIGVVISIVNTVHIVMVDKIKLKVIPLYSLAFVSGEGKKGFEVEVRNLSYMPITVRSIGIQLSNGKKMVIDLSLIKAGVLPKRIPARESVTFPILGFRMPITDLDAFIAQNAEALSRAKYVTVETGGGLVFKGTDKAFKDIVRKARAVVKKKHT